MNKRKCHVCGIEMDRNKNAIFRILMTIPSSLSDDGYFGSIGPNSYTLYFCKDDFENIAGEVYGIEQLLKQGIKR